MLTDRRIGVLMGGSSAEREISVRSGTAVFNALKNSGYDAVAVEISGGQAAVRGRPGVVACESSDICEALKGGKIGIAFLALHGGYGENGSMQGLLEVAGIPYTGSGVMASALAMDKEMSKKVFIYHRIPVPPFRVISRQPAAGSRESEAKDLGLMTAGFDLPWVIKPATEGSSIGVSIVSDDASLKQAIGEASGLGERIIIEKYIEGREIQVGILNNKVLGSVEIRPGKEFYSYAAKYTPGLAEYILPPEIDPALLRKTEDAALSANKALGCGGAVRVDLILDKQGFPYVLEVNTIPGMTESSLLPKIAGLAGLDFISLIEEILMGALSARGQVKKTG